MGLYYIHTYLAKGGVVIAILNERRKPPPENGL
jgi:hypothetical protein